MRYSSPAARSSQLPDIKEQIFADKFGRAVKAQRMGNLDKARGLVLELLAVNVRHVESLHLLGVIEYQCKHLEVAAKMFQRAIAVNSRNPVYHCDLGKIWMDMGRLEEAAAEFDQALKLRPDFADGHHSLGNLHSAKGEFEQAVSCYLRALKSTPCDANLCTNLGNAYLHQGKVEVALKMYGHALRFDSGNLDAHLNMGTAYLSQNEWEKALECYEKALKIQPRHALTLYNIGVCYQKRKMYDEAQSAYEKALEVEPDSNTVCLNLIAVLRLKKDVETSEKYCRQLIARNPKHAEAHCGIADLYFDQHRYELAIEYYRKALELRPEYAEAYSNLGCVYSNMGAMAEAEQCYEKALALDPDHVNAHCNMAFLLLTRGDYEKGLYHHEWRYRHQSGAVPRFPGPQWDGRALHGERVLLYGEQGIGDSLQFLRYLPMVSAAGATVLLAVQAPLRRLVEELDGIEERFYNGDALSEYDYQCALLSLPLAFHTTPETIPAAVPYLKIPAEAQQTADALDWPATGLRVGLVWSGNPNHTNDHNRSIPLRDLAPLWQLEGVNFFSLQMGAGTAQLDEAPGPLTDLTTGITDFADTAARMARLDLVIAVDTSVAHLAGALGLPVWVLLPNVPDWRWFYERTDSPWYPSMRLFRQPEVGDWATVANNLRNALAALAAEKAGGLAQ
jgi:tetratricopeptide (TPR) repeat protein